MLASLHPLHAAWRDDAARAAAARADLDARLDAVRLCAHWLIESRVRIDTVALRTGRTVKPLITVEPSPRLRGLFGDDVGAGQHWDVQHGALDDYRAVRYGCEIRWSEVRA